MGRGSCYEAETQIVRFGNHRPFYGGEDVKGTVTEKSIELETEFCASRAERESVLMQKPSV